MNYFLFQEPNPFRDKIAEEASKSSLQQYIEYLQSLPAWAYLLMLAIAVVIAWRVVWFEDEPAADETTNQNS